MPSTTVALSLSLALSLIAQTAWAVDGKPWKKPGW